MGKHKHSFWHNLTHGAGQVLSAPLQPFISVGHGIEAIGVGAGSALTSIGSGTGSAIKSVGKGAGGALDNLTSPIFMIGIAVAGVMVLTKF